MMELYMKRPLFALMTTLVFTSIAIGNPCVVGSTKHCYQQDKVPDDVFDKNSGCGINPKKIEEHAGKGDKFSNDVKAYALKKQELMEAINRKADKKTILTLKGEMADYISKFTEPGLLIPEEVANIPPMNNFVCKTSLTEKQADITQDIIEGAPLYLGKHPVINVFNTDRKSFNKDTSKFDFCKIEACNFEIRTKGQSDSICTGLSNYMNQKEQAKKFEGGKLPTGYTKEMVEATLGMLKQTEAKTEAAFEKVNVPVQLLHQLPVWSEFRAEVKKLGCEKQPGKQ
jgi:hypothetical protein